MASKETAQAAETKETAKTFKIQHNGAHIRYVEGLRFLPGAVTEISADDMDKLKKNSASAKLFEQKVLEEK